MQKNKDQLVFLLSPLCALVMVEMLQHGGDSPFLSPLTLAFWMNAAFYYGFYLLVRFLTNRTAATIITCNILFFILGTVNFYTIHFRTTALLPWDIFAAKTAANVLPGLKLFIPARVILAAFYICASLVLCLKMRFNDPVRKKRAASLIAAGTLLAAFAVILVTGKNCFWMDSWNQTKASRQNGLMLNLALNMQILNNKAPKGYSEKNVAKILSGVTENQPQATKIKPNIIAIMNESFSDLSVLGDLQLSEDVMPFVHNLKENTIRGQLVVPVFGGGTCNTEYEFLTGNTCAFMLSGSYPLQQYVHKETTSIASVLKEQGYQTIAIHPYYPNGWGRQRAYPLLGFDTFLSLDDFQTAPLLRSYVSDRGSYQKIVEQYENKAADDRLFIFNVTMQNHCGYDTHYDNLTEDVTFPNDTLYPQAKQYFSLVKQSDKAIEELVSYFKNQKEPTIILFFGDHQPPIETKFYEKILSSSSLSEEEQALRKHTVPFFIWANYQMDSQDMGPISSNYLSGLLLKTVGLPLNSYQLYLDDLSKKLPVISASTCLDAQGTLRKLDDLDDLVADYRIIQYNAVFK